MCATEAVDFPNNTENRYLLHKWRKRAIARRICELDPKANNSHFSQVKFLPLVQTGFSRLSGAAESRLFSKRVGKKILYECTVTNTIIHILPVW